MLNIDAKAFQREIREINEMNGWFDAERPFSSDIALLHSEVNECALAALMGGTADNSPEEMADIFIRLMDTADRYDFHVTKLYEEYLEADVAVPGTRPLRSTLHYMTVINIHITQAYEGYRKSNREAMEKGLAEAYKNLIWATEDAGVDLLAEVRAKLERNRQRGYKYGGKVE